MTNRNPQNPIKVATASPLSASANAAAQDWETLGANDGEGAVCIAAPFLVQTMLLSRPQERSEECVGYAVTAVSPNRQIFVITVVWIGGVECVDVLESEAPYP